MTRGQSAARLARDGDGLDLCKADGYRVSSDSMGRKGRKGSMSSLLFLVLGDPDRDAGAAKAG